MSLLGPNGQPMPNDPRNRQQRRAAARASHRRQQLPPAAQHPGAPPAGVPVPLDPRSWGLGFIVQPDGTVLALQFHADEDDLHTVDMGGHPWILLRARPTEQGHLTAPSLEAWLDYAPGAAAALQAVADADQVNRDAAEQPPPPDDPTTGS